MQASLFAGLNITSSNRNYILYWLKQYSSLIGAFKKHTIHVTLSWNYAWFLILLDITLYSFGCKKTSNGLEEVLAYKKKAYAVTYLALSFIKETRTELL